LPRPRDVLQEAAQICFHYNTNWAYTDQFAADALKDLASQYGLELIIEPWTKQNKTQLFMELQSQFQQGNVQIPPDQYLLKDLRLVKRRVTQSGISIHFPHTADKRHCDFAPAVARALGKWISDIIIEAPLPGSEDYDQYICNKMLEQELDEFNNPKSWWDK
jgi:phage FluMu gp28-like protein